MLRKIKYSWRLLLLALVTFQSCSPVKLISDYDEITDKTVTDLQRKVSTFFIKLERNIGTPDAGYDKHKDFYDEVRVDLSTLEIRAASMDKNQIVQEQVKELMTMVDKLEALHKIGFGSIELVRPLRQPFNSAFTAIIKLQTALKRGEKTNK